MSCGMRVDNFRVVGTGCTDAATNFLILEESSAPTPPYENAGLRDLGWDALIDAARRDEVQIVVNEDRNMRCCAAGGKVALIGPDEKCSGELVDKDFCRRVR